MDSLIKAYASLSFMVLIIYRVMRQRLRLAKSNLSLESAPRQLKLIQRHTITINDAAPIAGISTIHQAQAAVLADLKLKKPTLETQLPLL